MSTSYNTEECIKNLIEEFEGIIGELKDCLILIDFANNKDKIENLKQKAKEAKERARSWF